MRILYASGEKVDDPHIWSGLVASMRRALVSAGCEVEVLDGIPFECNPLLRLRHQWHKRFGRGIHQLQLEPAILARAARRIENRFSRGDCAAVFSPGTGVPVATLVDANIPVFTFLDASKELWIETYFGLGSLCSRSRAHVQEMDRISLRRHRTTFVSSDWARDGILRAHPGVSVEVVPFGANLTHPPRLDEVEQWIDSRSRDELRLLFLGKEWERKGGPEALALVRALRTQGVAAVLEVVGCTPVLSDEERLLVRLHGFLDRHTTEGLAKFHHLLSAVHALLFLSRAEAFGIAVAEACAYGVPTLGTRVGGIPSAVRDGYSGWLIERADDAVRAIERLVPVWRSAADYRQFALHARADFENRLNWEVVGQTLKARMANALRLAPV